MINQAEMLLLKDKYCISLCQTPHKSVVKHTQGLALRLWCSQSAAEFSCQSFSAWLIHVTQVVYTAAKPPGGDWDDSVVYGHSIIEIIPDLPGNPLLNFFVQEQQNPQSSTLLLCDFGCINLFLFFLCADVTSQEDESGGKTSTRWRNILEIFRSTALWPLNRRFCGKHSPWTIWERTKEKDRTEVFLPIVQQRVYRPWYKSTGLSCCYGEKELNPSFDKSRHVVLHF